MLSYNSPVPVQGSSSANMSTVHQTVRSSPDATRLPTPVLANGAQTDGVMSARADLSGKPAVQHHIWLVTGPAGCGKTTVAEHIARSLHLPYVEGDEYHPQANIDKMSEGTPLTDADRWDWLTILREESVRRLEAGHDGVVLTCSALKRKYRDVIRVAPYFAPNLCLHFIYLHAPEEVLLQRVRARKNHYMGANMVQSQFNILEPPAADETDVISVDVSGTPEEVEAEVLERVVETMKAAER